MKNLYSIPTQVNGGFTVYQDEQKSTICILKYRL